MNEKRQQLIAMRQAAKTLIAAGAYDSVNDALIDMYKRENANITEFKTLKEWSKAGKRVKKGSKSYVVWARPKEIHKPEAQTEEKKMKYFPMCYLFSNEQVD